MGERKVLSMSIRCGMCGNYIYKGTKFNCRKEEAAGETYLGIQIDRFYVKCTRCCAEITIKTDPQNSDYTVESGATRNFKPWRARDEQVDDVMSAVENRTLNTKCKMDDIAAVDELKSTRSRQETVGTNAMLEAVQGTEWEGKKIEEEDEALLKSIRPQERISDEALFTSKDLISFKADGLHCKNETIISIQANYPNPH